MKKILFINDYLKAGGAENVLEQTINLLKEEYEIDTFIGNKNRILPTNPFEYIFSFKYYKKLKLKLEYYRPDIIFLFNYYHLLSPSILKAIKEYKNKNEVKVIMSVHDFHLLSPNSGFCHFNYFGKKIRRLNTPPNILQILFYKWDHRGIIYSILKSAQYVINYKILKLYNTIDIFISPSNFLKELLLRKYNNVFLIRNPIEIKEGNKLIHKKEDTLDMVFIGRISFEKGLKEFIESLSKINIPYTFTIIGDGEELDNLKQLVDKLNLQRKIFFKGYMIQEELKKELSNYNILVLPSLWYENAPLSLVEGSLSGLKILTMDYGGMKEIAELCGNYCLLREDFSNLEDCLIYLKSIKFNTDLAKIKQIFSLERYKKEIIKIIEG